MIVFGPPAAGASRRASAPFPPGDPSISNWALQAAAITAKTPAKGRPTRDQPATRRRLGSSIGLSAGSGNSLNEADDRATGGFGVIRICLAAGLLSGLPPLTDGSCVGVRSTGGVAGCALVGDAASRVGAVTDLRGRTRSAGEDGPAPGEPERDLTVHIFTSATNGAVFLIVAS